MTNVTDQDRDQDPNPAFAAFAEKATRAYAEYAADMNRAMESLKTVITVGDGDELRNGGASAVEDRTVRAVAAMIREMMGGDRYPYGVAQQIAERAHAFYALHFTLLPNIYVRETPETAAAIAASEKAAAKTAAALAEIKAVETSKSAAAAAAAAEAADETADGAAE